MKEQELQTSRLTLRPLHPDFASGLLPIWSSGEVIRFTYMRPVKDQTDCVHNVVALMDTASRREDVGPYVILLGNTVIGMAGAVRMSRETHEHELYYHLGKPYWGNGYAPEAASAVMDQVFAMPLVYRLSAEVVAENAASIRVLEKLGMRQEGRLRGKFYRDGIHRDLYVYSILRNEWQLRRALDAVRQQRSGV